MSSTHDVQAKKAVSQVLAFAIGVAVGVLAWAEYSSPAIALALPLAWALAPTRFAAFFLTFGYHFVDFHAILTPVFHPILTPPVGA